MNSNLTKDIRASNQKAAQQIGGLVWCSGGGFPNPTNPVPANSGQPENPTSKGPLAMGENTDRGPVG